VTRASPPALVDTHAHLDDPALGDAPGRLEARWNAAHAVGVVAALAVGVAPSSWARTVAIARALPGVGTALGIHPQVVPELDDATVDAALAALPDRLRDAGAAAVGECGYDGGYPDRERQLRVLRAHLAIARAMQLPVSLHVFGPGAHGTVLGLLRETGALPAGGAVHGYSGSAELVREYVRFGLCISFAGSVTRSNARRPLVAARAVPLDHLLVETDAPFQPAGADARDRRLGEPADLPQIVAAIAQARAEPLATLAAATTRNALRTFPQLSPRARVGSDARDS
jgi:TatD DNase family protein